MPAQSGCDLVLKRMKRMYTVGFYEEMLARIRATVPGVAISSDFIVGFCGEDEASFERTVGLVERSRFKNSFIFKYSPRETTKAASLYADDVPEEVKKRRNQRAYSPCKRRSVWKTIGSWVGQTVEVLVEGPSKKTARRDGWEGGDQLTGRTVVIGSWCSRGPSGCSGEMVRVVVEDASAVASSAGWRQWSG